MNYLSLSNISTIIFYIIIVLATTGFIHSAQFYEGRKANQFVVLAILTAALPAAFRFGVGKDYLPFFEYGKQISSLPSVNAAMTFSRGVEASFAFVLYYSEKIFGNAAPAIGLYAIITQVLMISGFWRLRAFTKPEGAVFIYMCSFYWRTYNIFRQALAVAIVFFAIVYLLEKKRLRFIILVLAATVIHRTAIVALILLWYFRPTRKKNIFSSIIDYAIPIIAFFAIGEMFELVSRIPLLARYVTYYSDVSSQSIFTTGTLLVLIQIIIYVIYRVRESRSKSSFAVSSVFDKAVFLDVIFYLLGFQIQFAARIGLYFTMLSYCAFAHVCGDTVVIYRKMKFSALQLAFILVSILYFISYMLSNGYGQIPYQLILP